MTRIANLYQPDLKQRIQQGIAWLERSSMGAKTTALSYAALELRYAIEQLALGHWYELIGRKITPENEGDVDSYKGLEARIRKIAGHQLAIDRHFEFTRIMMGELKIPMPLHTPQLGKLKTHWHTCSKICHLGWPLSSNRPGVATTTYRELCDVAETLKQHHDSLGWPVISDPAFVELRRRFIDGHATTDDIVALMRKVGVHAQVVFPDGRPVRMLGEAVPPEGSPD